RPTRMAAAPFTGWHRDRSLCTPRRGTASILCLYILSFCLPAKDEILRNVSHVPLRVPLDRTSPVPLYFQVAQHLQQAIESGELPVGTRLDNEIALADQLGLSRPTMRRAIQHL